MRPRLSDAAITNVERLMLLRTFTGFSALPLPALTAVAERMSKCFFPAGTVIAKEGTPPRTIYFIVDGEIQMNQGGRQLTSLGSKSVVGGLAYLARRATGPEMIAKQHTVTLNIAADDMEELLEDNFSQVVHVLRAISSQSLTLRTKLNKAAGYSPAVREGTCPIKPLDLVQQIFFLRKSISFAQTRVEALAQLASTSVEIRKPPGTVLWREGDPPDSILFPICGTVRAETSNGQRFCFGAGSSLGGLDCMAARPRWFTATVDDGLVALQQDHDRFLDVLEDHYELARDFLAAMADGLLELMERSSAPPPLE